MTEDKDELLVRKFFDENNVELPDNGFSNRVMRRLPDRTRRLNRIWTGICILAGVLMCFVFDWFDKLSEIFHYALSLMPEHSGRYIAPYLIWLLLLSLICVGGYKAVADD